MTEDQHESDCGPEYWRAAYYKLEDRVLQLRRQLERAVWFTFPTGIQIGAGYHPGRQLTLYSIHAGDQYWDKIRKEFRFPPDYPKAKRIAGAWQHPSEEELADYKERSLAFAEATRFDTLDEAWAAVEGLLEKAPPVRVI